MVSLFNAGGVFSTTLAHNLFCVPNVGEGVVCVDSGKKKKVLLLLLLLLLFLGLEGV
jgi:hypothetical protein